jgi:hypothetical protein
LNFATPGVDDPLGHRLDICIALASIFSACQKKPLNDGVFVRAEYDLVLKTPSPERSFMSFPARPAPIFGAYPSKNATKLAMD